MTRQARKNMNIGSSRKKKPVPSLLELEPPVTTHPLRATDPHNPTPATRSVVPAVRS
jgi:hypothetical protein